MARTDIYHLIGYRIAQARSQAELTQEELAAQLGVTNPTVSRWESGRARIGIEQLLEISRITGAPLEFLVRATAGRSELATQIADEMKDLPPSGIELGLKLWADLRHHFRVRAQHETPHADIIEHRPKSKSRRPTARELTKDIERATREAQNEAERRFPTVKDSPTGNLLPDRQRLGEGALAGMSASYTAVA